MSITVIIPAFNEAKRIGPMLEKYLSYFGDRVQFLVVLNGCIDDTESVVKSWQSKFPQQLKYIVLEESHGKGHAVRNGFLKADADIVGFVDADGSTSPEEFAKILNKLENDQTNDVVIASRYAPGAKVVNRDLFLRRLSGVVFKKMVKLITGLKFYDTQCGAKVFKKKVIENMAPNLYVNDMAFDVEMLLFCKKNKYKVLEVPTVWYDAEGLSPFINSKFKLAKTALRMLKSIILIRFQYFFK